MKKLSFLHQYKALTTAVLIIVLVFSSVLTGCQTTTHSIDYTVTEHPIGVYRYTEIRAYGSNSVLQRFYETYPSDKYQVVAVEKITQDILPIGGAFGGAVLGVIPSLIWNESLHEDAVIPFMVIPAAILGTVGYFVGSSFSNRYAVTYIKL